MNATSHVKGCEWDRMNVHYGHAPDNKLKYIYVRRPGNSLFEPWLVIARSAVMSHDTCDMRAGLGKEGLDCILQGGSKREI